jgi:hypothetical protein
LSPPSSLSTPLTPPLLPGTRSKASAPVVTRSKARPAAAAPGPKQPPPPPAFTQVQLKPASVRAAPVLEPQRRPPVVLRSAAAAATAQRGSTTIARRDIRVNVVTAGWSNRAAHFSTEQRETARAWRTSWMSVQIRHHSHCVMV